MKRVSIIIPAFNAAATVGEAIGSTLAQRCEGAEVIVVDDASIDETSKIVAAFGQEVYLYRRSANAGPAAARNEGIRLATGEWLTFLDADDVWTQDGLHALLRDAERHPEARIIQATFQDVWQGERGAPRHGNRLPGTLFHHTVFGVVGRLDEALRTGEDFDFWVRVKHHDLPIHRIEAVATFYHRRADPRVDRREAYYRSCLETLQRNLVRFRPKTL